MKPNEETSKTTKVLYVQHSSKRGGAPRSLLFLVERAREYGIEPTVVFFSPGPSVEDYKKAGIPVIVTNRGAPFHGSSATGLTIKIALRNLFGFFPTVLMTLRRLLKLRPDVVHLNSTCLFHVGLVFRLFSPKVRIICHARENVLPGLKGFPLRFFNKLIADRFIALDESVAASLKSPKVAVIPNFIDTERYARSGPLRSISGGDAFLAAPLKVLFLARVAEGNGAEIFLDVAEKMRPNKKIRFVMAGFYDPPASPYEKGIRLLAEKADNVTVVNFTQDVKGLIEACDVLLVPFDVPHFARAIIEAAALEVPSIGNDIASVRDLIENGATGIVCPPKDFPRAVETFLNDPEELRRMGKNARAAAIQKYDVSPGCRKTYALYGREVLK